MKDTAAGIRMFFNPDAIRPQPIWSGCRQYIAIWLDNRIRHGYMVIKTFLPNWFFDLLSYGTFELLYYAVAPTAMRDNIGFLSSMQIVIKYAPFCE